MLFKVLLKLVNIWRFWHLTMFLRSLMKFPTHCKISQFVTVSYNMVFYLKIHHTKFVLLARLLLLQVWALSRHHKMGLSMTYVNLMFVYIEIHLYDFICTNHLQQHNCFFYAFDPLIRNATNVIYTNTRIHT